jgi:hypothetical protein
MVAWLLTVELRGCGWMNLDGCNACAGLRESRLVCCCSQLHVYEQHFSVITPKEAKVFF